MNLDIFAPIVEFLQYPIIYIQNQKNAIMIRTKIHGINIILIIVFLLTSCNTAKNIQNIRNAGVALNDAYSYYVNDSLTFFCRFPGCYKQVADNQKIKDNLKKVNKNLPLKNCIACFKDFDPPHYDRSYFLFYFPNKKNAHYQLLRDIRKNLSNSNIDENKYVEGSVFRSDEIEKISFDFYVNENKYITGKYIPLENNRGYIYMIGNTGNNDHYQFFNHKHNFNSTVNSITTNEKYRDLPFKFPFDIGREYEMLEDTTINYLMPVYRLKYCEPNYTNIINSRRIWLQAYATYLSRLANEEKEVLETAREFRNPYNLRYKIVSSENALQINEAALNYLIQECKDERVVMINENHFTPQNRIFGEIILDSLYNYGFRYFGLEAVLENDTNINKRGFVITNTGFYTREPMMANLIRKAIEKGYYIFGYDHYTSDREKSQALNIYQKTIEKDSLSKVLIFAGFGHIDEAEKAKNWMAREFLLLTGIDPLTIEQQEFVVEDAYLMLLDTATLKNRSMACDIFIANNIDYELFATKSGYKDYSITIPEHIAKQAQIEPLMFIISVFVADEYQRDKTAIPVYNHLINNNATQINIKLKEREYYFTIKNRYGTILYQGNL